MKKNTISAFADKKVKMNNVTGGGYFNGTYDLKTGTRIDSQYVTQKGERDQLGDVATFDQFDGEMCVYK